MAVGNKLVYVPIVHEKKSVNGQLLPKSIITTVAMCIDDKSKSSIKHLDVFVNGRWFAYSKEFITTNENAAGTVTNITVGTWPTWLPKM